MSLTFLSLVLTSPLVRCLVHVSLPMDNNKICPISREGLLIFSQNDSSPGLIHLGYLNYYIPCCSSIFIVSFFRISPISVILVSLRTVYHFPVWHQGETD